jgi:hypothetical protein
MHASTSEESGMKNQGVVVAICDENNKTQREYEFKCDSQPYGPRRAKIFLPFDTHYKFLIKNTNICRIKVDIEIDGSIISDDGIVINALDTQYIERFIKSDKKFKFVKNTAEGVTDPDEKDNGKIVVYVTKEYVENPFHKITINDHWWKQPTSPWSDPYPGYWNTNPVYTSRNTTVMNTVMVGNIQCSAQSDNQVYCSAPQQNNIDRRILLQEEIGATVEGTQSNQTFGKTHWNSDGSPVFKFIFTLRASKEQEDKEYQEFLRLQAKYAKIGK